MNINTNCYGSNSPNYIVSRPILSNSVTPYGGCVNFQQNLVKIQNSPMINAHQIHQMQQIVPHNPQGILIPQSIFAQTVVASPISSQFLPNPRISSQFVQNSPKIVQIATGVGSSQNCFQNFPNFLNQNCVRSIENKKNERIEPKPTQDSQKDNDLMKFLEQQIEIQKKKLSETQEMLKKLKQKNKPLQIEVFDPKTLSNKTPPKKAITQSPQISNGLMDCNKFWQATMDQRAFYLLSLIQKPQTTKRGVICIYKPSMKIIKHHFGISETTICKVSELYKTNLVAWPENKNKNNHKRCLPKERVEEISTFLKTQKTEYWPKKIGKILHPEVLSFHSTKTGFYKAYFKSCKRIPVCEKTFLKYCKKLNPNLCFRKGNQSLQSQCAFPGPIFLRV